MHLRFCEIMQPIFRVYFFLSFFYATSYLILGLCNLFTKTCSVKKNEGMLLGLLNSTVRKPKGLWWRCAIKIFSHLVLIKEALYFGSWHCVCNQVQVWNLLYWVHKMELIRSPSRTPVHEVCKYYSTNPIQCMILKFCLTYLF